MGSGFKGSRFKVQGSGFKGSGFRVQRFRVQGSKVQGSGFRVQGSGFRAASGRERPVKSKKNLMNIERPTSNIE
jgi:hypothetical protein